MGGGDLEAVYYANELKLTYNKKLQTFLRNWTILEVWKGATYCQA